MLLSRPASRTARARLTRIAARKHARGAHIRHVVLHVPPPDAAADKRGAVTDAHATTKRYGTDVVQIHRAARAARQGRVAHEARPRDVHVRGGAARGEAAAGCDRAVACDAHAAETGCYTIPSQRIALTAQALAHASQRCDAPSHQAALTRTHSPKH